VTNSPAPFFGVARPRLVSHRLNVVPHGRGGGDSEPTASNQLINKPADILELTNLLNGLVTSDPNSVITAGVTRQIKTSTWDEPLFINRNLVASAPGVTLYASNDFSYAGRYFGSILVGQSGNNILIGAKGWDIVTGGTGNDLAKAGIGRDILTGGLGSDELWGGHGWNTFLSEIDNSADLLVIRSDQWVVNQISGKAGNNQNGEKCDIIEGLDTTDRIMILGSDTKDLSFNLNAVAHGIAGIGIYAKGSLEALYTGGDLSLDQIKAMTIGDGSEAGMGHQIWSYDWTQHPGTMTPTYFR